MIMMESPKNQCRIILLPNSKRPRTALPSTEIAVFSNSYSGKTLLRRPLQQRPLKKQMKGVLPQIRKTRERKRRDRKLSSKRMNKRCFFKRESSQKMLRMTTYMRCWYQGKTTEITYRESALIKSRTLEVPSRRIFLLITCTSSNHCRNRKRRYSMISMRLLWRVKCVQMEETWL